MSNEDGILQGQLCEPHCLFSAPLSTCINDLFGFREYGDILDTANRFVAIDRKQGARLLEFKAKSNYFNHLLLSGGISCYVTL